VPLATVSTYTGRLDLSQELKEKLGKTHGTGLAHAAAVVGLGGTGKTQLVLHYIEEHEAEYDTVLWIDVSTEETARSSYERCCRVLGLAVEASSDNKLLQDAPCVQAVLTWLRAQSDDQKWLVVTDNADDLSWDVSSIVPKGKAGTVVITSQDAHAPRRLLGGRSPTVKVDAMTSEEAVSLVTNHFQEPVCLGTSTWNLVEEITGLLDRLALPMDLAGARISVDAEDWGDLDAALRQYLSDYQQNQDKLLQDADFATAGSYNKTVWTAWETSMSSLRRMEHYEAAVDQVVSFLLFLLFMRKKVKDEPKRAIYPIKLLSFLTLFDRTNVQDELFRQASLGLDQACHELGTSVPFWLRKLLAKGDDGEWNNSFYRDTVNVLLRYGLVKPVGEPWKGVTMHGLVQRRARQELPHGHSQWHMVFLSAICKGTYDDLNGSNGLRFRRHLVLHFPPNYQLLRDQPYAQSKRQLAMIWEEVSLIYADDGRFNEAAQLQNAALEVNKVLFGEDDLRTLTTMSNLARSMTQQGLWKKATDLHSRVIQQREIQLGATHASTLMSRHYQALTMSREGKWDDAVAELQAIIGMRKEILGDQHDHTLDTMSTLAIAYQRQGRLKEAQEVQIQILEAKKKKKKSPERFDQGLSSCMRNLATTYSLQGKHREAEQLQVEDLKTCTDLYGRDHQYTLYSMVNLGIMYSNQGRHREAEKLEVEVLETKSRVLGPEHVDTLEAMTHLNITLSHLWRWEETEELGVKIVEVSSRILGQNHTDTLLAMDNLAWAAKRLGQEERAIDLMIRTATASSNVLGHDHPVCQRRRKTVKQWSATQNNDVEEVDGGSHEETNRI
jgi:tetratricopeptide (TPR) repeat protein